MLRNRTTNAASRYSAADAMRRARAFVTPIAPGAAMETSRGLVLAASRPGDVGALAQHDDLGFDSVTVAPWGSAAETLLHSDPVASHLLLVDGGVPPGGLVTAVRAMVAHLDISPSVAAVGVALDRPDGAAVTTGIDVVGVGADRGLPAEPLAPYEHAVGRVWPVVAASSTCLLVRAGLFLRVGGFDSAYSDRLCRDADLCLRFRRIGYQIMVVDCGSLAADQDPVPPDADDRARFLRRWGSFVEASFL